MDTSTDTGLRGLALLDAAIEQIENHPETWEQGVYRCGSGMCVAGWICELAGGRWLRDPADDDEISEYLAREPCDPDDHVGIFGPDDEEGVGANDRACTLLGTSDIAPGGRGSSSLFGAFNTLDDIKSIRDELAAGGLS